MEMAQTYPLVLYLGHHPDHLGSAHRVLLIYPSQRSQRRRNEPQVRQKQMPEAIGLICAIWGVQFQSIEL